MRLIDADALKSCYTGSNGLDDKASYESIRKMVDTQPTAYDVGKVVEQLEDTLKNEKLCYVRAEVKCREFESCEECGFARAIEIVKGCKIDNKN